MASILVRTRNGGKAWELRIKHRLLPKPVYRTYDTRALAEDAGNTALAQLARGTIPAWLQTDDRAAIKSIGHAIREHLKINPIAPATEKVLTTLVSEIGHVQLASVDYAWGEAWVQALKIEQQLTPGTIRKKVGALSGCFDWLVNRHARVMPVNHLEKLPYGYSTYNAHVAQILGDLGIDTPQDFERNRRIPIEEEDRVVAYLTALLEIATTNEERIEIEGAHLMFMLALRTAMRMRELYTLCWSQIDIANRTIHLGTSKRQPGRAVPLNQEAIELLQRPWAALRAAGTEGRVFPFWNGAQDKKSLDECSGAVSRMFSRHFKAVGSVDLHFHDTRHEAICRWVINAPQPLSSEALGRAAGMKDDKTRRRYLSLRGSELADMLG